MFQPFLCSEHYNSQVIELSTENSLQQTTQRLKETLKDQPVVLVGFSMGGILALDFIRHYSEQVIGLCLLNSNCHEDLPGREEGRNQHIAIAEKQGVASLIQSVYLPVYFSNTQCSEAQIVVEMAEELGLDVLKAQFNILSKRPNSETLLSQFDKPKLFLGARNDIPCPVEHQQFMSLIAQEAELHIIDNAGHFAPLEKPQEIKTIIEQWVVKYYD
jgi:pimeloyl-ACP methyl ester carboxylesterase